MNFGAFLLMPSPSVRPHSEIYARGLEIAQAAEALGYDGIWLAEHHFSNYGYLSRPLIMATHLAAKTSRIRIGTAVVVLPLHNPLMVAEEAATIDLLSEGRFDLGLGRGYQQYEFQRLGLDLKDSRARWEEAIEIVTRAFTEDSFSFQGEHFSFPETTVLPKPFQKPHPPIWVVGQSPESIDGAVRRGFNVVTGGAAFSHRQDRGASGAIRRCGSSSCSRGTIAVWDPAEDLRDGVGGRRGEDGGAWSVEHAGLT